MIPVRLVALVTLLALLTVTVGCDALTRAAPPATAQTARPLVYVALGASDSVGVGADKPEIEGWVPQLAGRLPAGSRLVNLGVSGSLLSDALRQQLPVALGSDPDVVTVWLAVNDFNAQIPLPRYQANLNNLLGQLAATHAQVYIANVPDLTRVPIYEQFGVKKSDLAPLVTAWNVAITQAADQHGATVVDLYTDWQELADHPEYVARDGFHPSAEGYRRLADLFWDVMQPRLAAGG